ncbi:MAG: hypothetical protein ACKO5A_06460 [Actinomycetota bacterium]
MSTNEPPAVDVAELERLEADLAAVEAAMDALVAITSGTSDGEAAAAQIRAVVNDERFPADSAARSGDTGSSDAGSGDTGSGDVGSGDTGSDAVGSETVGDGFVDEQVDPIAE